MPTNIEAKEKLPTITKEMSDRVKSFKNAYSDDFRMFTSEGCVVSGHFSTNFLFGLLGQTLSDSERVCDTVNGSKRLYGGGIQWILLSCDSVVVDFSPEGKDYTRFYNKSRNWSWVLKNIWHVVASDGEAQGCYMIG